MDCNSNWRPKTPTPIFSGTPPCESLVFTAAGWSCVNCDAANMMLGFARVQGFFCRMDAELYELMAMPGNIAIGYIYIIENI